MYYQNLLYLNEDSINIEKIVKNVKPSMEKENKINNELIQSLIDDEENELLLDFDNMFLILEQEKNKERELKEKFGMRENETVNNWNDRLYN